MVGILDFFTHLPHREGKVRWVSAVTLEAEEGHRVKVLETVRRVSLE